MIWLLASGMVGQRRMEMESNEIRLSNGAKMEMEVGVEMEMEAER